MQHHKSDYRREARSMKKPPMPPRTIEGEPPLMEAALVEVEVPDELELEPEDEPEVEEGVLAPDFTSNLTSETSLPLWS
mgnify:CR=1 FL=1